LLLGKVEETEGNTGDEPLGREGVVEQITLTCWGELKAGGSKISKGGKELRQNCGFHSTQ
jgi:hypothetical protein